MVRLRINEQDYQLDIEPSMPLLWAIRDAAGLTGTKYGCGLAQCGACTVHVDGTPTRSCVTPVSVVQHRAVTTIEGLRGPVGDAVKAAWVKWAVAQCGYCQSGQVMAAAALLAANPMPTQEAMRTAMTGNICRCCTYHRVRAAITEAAGLLASGAQDHA